jgi:hypothetical protein
MLGIKGGDTVRERDIERWKRMQDGTTRDKESEIGQKEAGRIADSEGESSRNTQVGIVGEQHVIIVVTLCIHSHIFISSYLSLYLLISPAPPPS